MISHVIKGWQTANLFLLSRHLRLCCGPIWAHFCHAFVWQQPWATISWPTRCYRPVGGHLLTTPCWLKASPLHPPVSLTLQVSSTRMVLSARVHPWQNTCLYTVTRQALCFSNTMVTNSSVHLSASTYGCLCCVFSDSVAVRQTH